jgi:hypothetical protein
LHFAFFRMVMESGMFRFNQTANDGEFKVKEEHREKIKLKDKQSM